MMAFFPGFFLACGDFGQSFDDSCSPAPFFFFFYKWRSDRAHQFDILGQDQSTVAQPAETTVAECPWRIACELLSLKSSHTMPGQHSQPTPTSSQPPRVISGLIATYNRDNINITCKQNLNDNSQLYLHLQPLWNWPYAQKTWCRSDGDWHIQGIQSDNPVLAKHKNVRFFFVLFF